MAQVYSFGVTVLELLERLLKKGGTTSQASCDAVREVVVGMMKEKEEDRFEMAECVVRLGEVFKGGGEAL